MKKKIVKLFRRLFAGIQKTFKKVKDFLSGKKKLRILENHYEDPIYLLFPDEYIPDESRKRPEGPNTTGGIEVKHTWKKPN